jgi:hypothetical protein
MLPAVTLSEHWPTWVVFDYGIRQQWMGTVYVCLYRVIPHGFVKAETCRLSEI